jgi:hypothetical protein
MFVSMEAFSLPGFDSHSLMILESGGGRLLNAILKEY